MAKLIILDRDRSVTHEILEDEVLIGRGKGCSVRLSDPLVSTEHCRIRAVPGVGFKLVDLESTNGTKVNGSFVNQHLLRDGDVIQAGKVRITFFGEKDAPAAPGPAPAAPGAGKTAVSLGAPRRRAAGAGGRAAPARSAGRRPPAGEGERESRVRPRRKPSPLPVVIPAVVLGLVLFGLAAWFFGARGFRLNKNQRIFEEMNVLVGQHRYDEAIALAETADPAGDRRAYDKIQAQKLHIQSLRASGVDLEREAKARHAYYVLEVWIQKHRHDVEGIVAHLEEYIRKWNGPGTKHWANQARIRLENILGRQPGGGASPPEDGEGPPGGGGTIDRAWRIARAKAADLSRGDRYQDAIDALEDFWEANSRLADPFEAWKKKVDDEVGALAERAAERWKELDAAARRKVDAGDYDGAIEIYHRIAERFGLEKYQYLAGAAIRKLQHD